METADRAILVIDQRPALAVALLDRIPPAQAIIHRTAPAESGDASTRLRPWPFAVLGATRDTDPPLIPPALLHLFHTRPIPVLWLGALPADLPVHARSLANATALLDAAERLLTPDPALAPLCLAAHRGLSLRGRTIQSPALEGMLAAPATHWALPPTAVRAARDAIARHHLPLRIVTDADDRIHLEKAAGATG
jgi:hypothetical protein